MKSEQAELFTRFTWAIVEYHDWHDTPHRSYTIKEYELWMWLRKHRPAVRAIIDQYGQDAIAGWMRGNPAFLQWACNTMAGCECRFRDLDKMSEEEVLDDSFSPFNDQKDADHQTRESFEKCVVQRTFDYIQNFPEFDEPAHLEKAFERSFRDNFIFLTQIRGGTAEAVGYLKREQEYNDNANKRMENGERR